MSIPASLRARSSGCGRSARTGSSASRWRRPSSASCSSASASRSRDDWDVTVPTWRARDVTREIDVVEEVARIVLDRVPDDDAAACARSPGTSRASSGSAGLLEDVLVGAGFSEAYTWSLVASDPDPNAIRLPDPMSSDHSILRTTLGQWSHRGRPRERRRGQRGHRSVRARARLPAGASLELPEERWRVGGIVAGGFDAARRGPWRSLFDALHLDLRPSPHGVAVPASRGRPRAAKPGGSASCTRPCSRAPGGCSSSTFSTLTAPIPERILYEDVITFPPLRQDIAVVVAGGDRGGRSRRRGRSRRVPRSCERRVCSTSTGETRRVRAASRSPCTSRSRFRTGRSPTTTGRSCASGSSRAPRSGRALPARELSRATRKTRHEAIRSVPVRTYEGAMSMLRAASSEPDSSC